MLGFDALNACALGELPTTDQGTAPGFLATHAGTPALVPAALGFKAANAGLPRVITAIATASGFETTHLGVPALVPSAVGFRATRIGIASMWQGAQGISAHHLGVPTAQSLLRATALRAVNFGTPTTPVPRAFQASGFLAMHAYEPSCVRFTPHRARHYLCHVVHLRAVKLGVPTAS